MKDLIIQPQYGGLGDHLFYSHIPRIAVTGGGVDRVFISKHASYRHPDIRKLVWELNPYVAGFIDAPGVCPPVTPPSNKGENLLDQIMFSFGLDDGMRWHEPEIYYTPVIRNEYSGVIYDPNYVSNAGDSISRKMVEKYFKKSRVDITMHMVALNDKAVILQNYCNMNVVHTDLFLYCDALASCKAVYCFASGSATLSAALRRKANVFYTNNFNEMFLHSKNNVYIYLAPNKHERIMKFLKKTASKLLPAMTKRILRRLMLPR